MASPRPRPPIGRAIAGLLAVAAVVIAGGCSGEEAVPIDPANPPTTGVDLTDVTHSIDPTEDMRDAAEQQCLDQPELAEGYIRAVDPEDGRVLAEVTVDCDEVRAAAG